VASMVFLDMIFLLDIGFLPVDGKRRCQLQNSVFPDLFPKRARGAANFMEAFRRKCSHTHP
jgi:hypothetical protein